MLVDNIISYNCCNYCGMKRGKEAEKNQNQHLSKIEHKFSILEERMYGDIMVITVRGAYQEKSRG